MHDLSGRRALFVGGSSGIGLASARLFHSLGATVILAGRSAARLEAARQALGNTSSVETVVFDFAQTGQVDEALAQLPLGGIDHLVITAASVTHGPFSEQPLAELRAMFDSKFWGAYGMVRAALPYLRAGGSIVLFSGVLSRRPGINCAALGAACAAVEALSQREGHPLSSRVARNARAKIPIREGRDTALHLVEAADCIGPAPHESSPDSGDTIEQREMRIMPGRDIAESW